MDDYQLHLRAISERISSLRLLVHDAEALYEAPPRALNQRLSDVETELQDLIKTGGRTTNRSLRELTKDFHDNAAVVRVMRHSGRTKYDFGGYVRALRDTARLMTDQLDRIDRFVDAEKMRTSRRRT